MASLKILVFGLILGLMSMTLSLAAEENSNFLTDMGEGVAGSIMTPLASDDLRAARFPDTQSCVSECRAERDFGLDYCPSYQNHDDQVLCQRQVERQYRDCVNHCDTYNDSAPESSTSPFEDRRGEGDFPY